MNKRVQELSSWLSARINNLAAVQEARRLLTRDLTRPLWQQENDLADAINDESADSPRTDEDDTDGNQQAA